MITPQPMTTPASKALPFRDVPQLRQGRAGGVRPTWPEHEAPDQGPPKLFRRRDRHDHHGRSGALPHADGRPRGHGHQGTLARIVQVEARHTVLRRTADDEDPYERPIVANADQLVIVTALADPPPRIGMIDRILVAGFDAGIA